MKYNIENLLKLLDDGLFEKAMCFYKPDEIGYPELLWENSFNDFIYILIWWERGDNHLKYGGRIKNKIFKECNIEINKHEMKKLSLYISMVINRKSSINEK